MRRYAVVVNDCAAPAVPGIVAVRSRDTAYGQRNFTLRFDELAHGLPALLDARQMDWLEILGHLFATDLACERGNGDLDWHRAIDLWLPVRDPDFWSQHRASIEGIWTDLTADELNLRFQQDPDAPPPPRMALTPHPEHDCVALLSGGQDSFTGALDLLHEGRRPLLLSHTASGAVNNAQNTVETILRGVNPDVVRLKLGAQKARGRLLPGMESSQRSRTFLFVGAAALVAALSGSGEVQVNENGIMALHLPLTPARIGSLSTHTASPPILERMRLLASQVLGQRLRIENRLVRMTKPEVVGRAIELEHGENMAQTVSCWQIGRKFRHCGTCTPCLMRRISCEHHALTDVPYEADPFEDANALWDPRARDNLTHLVSLVQDLSDLSDLELEYEYPELLAAAPAITLAEAIDLHRRWAQQASDVLFTHPVPAGLR